MILHLSDRSLYSLTGVDWARRYVKAMQARGVRKMLSRVDPQALALMEKVEPVALLGRDNIFLSTPRHRRGPRRSRQAPGRALIIHRSGKDQDAPPIASRDHGTGGTTGPPA